MAQDWTDNCFQADHQGQTDLQAMENNFAALKSCFSGDAAPSNPVAGMWWYDTTNNILKIRNEANSAWLDVFDFGNGRIAAGIVAEASIATGAVTADKIGTGAVTADKIGTGAVTEGKIASGAVTTNKIDSGAVTPVKLSQYTAGTYWVISNPATITGAWSSWTMVRNALIPRAGVVTVHFRLSTQSESGFCYGRIYKNNSPYGNTRSAYFSSPWEGDENVVVSAGDTIQIYAYAATDPLLVSISNFAIGVGNPDTITSSSIA